MKKLVILSNTFPDDNFIRSEIEAFKDFDKIVSVQVPMNENKSMQIINESVIHYLYNEKLNNTSKFEKIIKVIFNPMFYKELFIERKKIFTKNFILLMKNIFAFLGLIDNYSTNIKEFLIENEFTKEDEIVFYAYRMHKHMGAAYLLHKEFPNSIVIARGHGYDVYEYRWDTNYIVFQKQMLNKMDLILSISKEGKKYINEHYGINKDKILVSYLGTKDCGIQEYKKTNYLRVISCSRIDPLKRIDLIHEAVINTNVNIEWIHIGGGKLFESYKKKYEIDSDTKKIKFLGKMNNEEILEYYKINTFDVFINYSEYEGVPVTLMEAISFGIPSIATDVGGVSEIIDSNNGFLIDPQTDPREVSKIFEKIMDMSLNEILEIRKSAREKYMTTFNLKYNKKELIEVINNKGLEK